MYDLNQLTPVRITRYPGDNSGSKPSGFPEDGDGKPESGEPKD